MSDWLPFDVLQPTLEQREEWLTSLLGHPPESAGLLAGDFLPSLLAGAPDPRVLQAFVSYMHAEDAMVSGMAAAGLEHFPLSEVQPAVVDSIVRSGPSDALAYFATQHLGWTRSDEDRVVHATAAYLLPVGTRSQSTAAYTLLHFIFNVQNHAWPADAELKAYADEQVLSAAPSVIEKDDTSVIHELAVYLGSMSSRRSHELLLQLAGRSDNAGEQARIALTCHPEATDLPTLAAVLVTSGDADPRGTDRSSLPYSLVKGYGDAALPYLEKAVRSSPYVWVRTQSAQQLALRNRPLGFEFLLDAIESNQPYKAEMVRWVQQRFTKQLPPGATDQQIADFLRAPREKTFQLAPAGVWPPR